MEFLYQLPYPMGGTDGEPELREPKPPYCVCCEYMRGCSSDSQKADYCPDPNYRKWLKGKESV